MTKNRTIIAGLMSTTILATAMIPEEESPEVSPVVVTAQGEVVDTPDEIVPEAEADSGRTDAPPHEIVWAEDYRAAAEQSKGVGLPMFAYFTKSSCRPCVALRRDVFSDMQVIHYLNEKFVPTKIQLPEDPTSETDQQLIENWKFALRHEVDGCPTISVCYPSEPFYDGNLVEVVNGEEVVDVSTFLQRVEAARVKLENERKE